MASLTLPFPDFVNGTTADGNQVDANLEALRAFLVNSVPHSDGTNGFTGLPVLPATAPAATHPVRKDLLDSTVASREKSLLPAGQVYTASGSASVTLNGSGQTTITMGVTMPNPPYCIILQATGTSTDVKPALAGAGRTSTTFVVNGTASAAVTFDWVAYSI